MTSVHKILSFPRPDEHGLNKTETVMMRHPTRNEARAGPPDHLTVEFFARLPGSDEEFRSPGLLWHELVEWALLFLGSDTTKRLVPELHIETVVDGQTTYVSPQWRAEAERGQAAATWRSQGSREYDEISALLNHGEIDLTAVNKDSPLSLRREGDRYKFSTPRFSTIAAYNAAVRILRDTGTRRLPRDTLPPDAFYLPWLQLPRVHTIVENAKHAPLEQPRKVAPATSTGDTPKVVALTASAPTVQSKPPILLTGAVAKLVALLLEVEKIDTSNLPPPVDGVESKLLLPILPDLARRALAHLKSLNFDLDPDHLPTPESWEAKSRELVERERLLSERESELQVRLGEAETKESQIASQQSELATREDALRRATQDLLEDRDSAERDLRALFDNELEGFKALISEATDGKARLDEREAELAKRFRELEELEKSVLSDLEEKETDLKKRESEFEAKMETEMARLQAKADEIAGKAFE